MGAADDAPPAAGDDPPNCWTCSYVMTGDNGVNLLGTLDVDENRARFVASSGLFGTAYQFVMPREQIQVLRVPTASTPYNALELHTKYRRNILCDFDDNVSVFRQVVDVMKLHQLPQESPLIAVLPADVSEAAARWRAKTAQRRREREERERLKTVDAEAGEQLTAQFATLHSEKVQLQRRMLELERENEHLHGEVEVLYAQVDEQSDRIDGTFKEFERAAEEAVRSIIGTGRRDDEARAAERAEWEREAAARASEAAAAAAAAAIAAEKERQKTDEEARRSAIDANANESPRLAKSSEGDGASPTLRVRISPASGKKRPPTYPNGSPGELRSPRSPRIESPSAVSPATLEARRGELMESIVSLREERGNLEEEVTRLRSELERTDASVDAGPKDDASQDEMLMREVHLLLKRQAELAGNLAEVRREKDMLEKENELLLDQRDVAAAEAAEAAREAAEAAYREAEAFREAEKAAEAAMRDAAEAAAAEVRERTRERGRDREDASFGASSRRGSASSSRCESPRGRKKGPFDGPDAELAEKLIGRLERAGESDEATALRTEMEEMKAELGRMREASKDARAGKDAEAATAAAKEASELRAKLRATEAALAAERARAREEEETSKTLLAKLKAAEAALAAERARAGENSKAAGGDSEETRLLREALERVESELARQREETAWRVADAELRARKDAEAELRAPDADRRPEDRFLTPGASPASSEGTTSPKSPTGITAQPGKREQRAEHRGISLPG